ncbi:MAG: multidrug efflux pump subunit AcrA (membrane-fusion protein) [Granulosicoccus sp.]|jgi:multidrug efflux pump subunit AcrA (membrane-fusion protein)
MENHMTTTFFLTGRFSFLLLGTLLLSLQVLAQDDITTETQLSALAVEVDNIERGPVAEIVFADGNAQAIRKEFLQFENAGRVAFLKSNDDGGPLREGDVVKSGELLAELDCQMDDAGARAARAELDTVRAALANAKADYERAKRLRDGKAIQASRFDGMETSYKQALADMRGAEARFDQVRAGLRQLQIRAPFDGLVAFVNVREGQYVSPEQFSANSQGSAATTSPIVIIDPSSFEIIVELPVVSGRRVAINHIAYILDEGTLAHAQEYGYASLADVDSIDDLLIIGRVGSVSPAIDPSSRSMRARIVTDVDVEGLTDGGYVTVWIETARRENVVMAPLESLIFRGETAYSFVIDPNTNLVEQRVVSVGLTGQEGVEVTEGLLEGDVVVTKGRYRLTSGMSVRPNTSLEMME